MTDHKLFPLGLNCVHCERWHSLNDALDHIEEFHDGCGMCGAEALLCKALMDEAASALVTVSERRRVPV